MDLRYAWRAMLRNRGFALLVILTMALGIGANTTMFSVIRAVFLRPLDFPNQERLVTLWESDPQNGVAQRRVTPANFVDWEAQSSVFEEMGVLPSGTGPSLPFNIVGNEGVERVHGVYASSGFFRAVGIPAMLGRTLGQDEDRLAQQRKVVISHSYWKDRFSGDPSILGKTLEVDTFRGGKFTIVGVMPAGFDFPGNAQIWLSLGDWGGGPMPPPDTAERCCSWHTVVARLKPGVTLEKAAAEMSVIARRISARHPRGAPVTEVQIVPLRETMVGSHRLTLFTLFGAVGCVLLIACANIANLLLSRAVARRREILTRMALGAARWRIARQLLIESSLLSSFGAALGLVLSAWLQGPVVHALSESVTLIESARIDWQVLGFTALLTVMSAVLCGLAPLVHWRGTDWGSRGQTENPGSVRLRQALIVGEVAVAVTLVASAGLLVRTLANLQAVDLGFPTEHMLTVSLDVTTGPLRGRGNSARFIEELMPRLAALPGARAVAATTELPLDRQSAVQAITREGQPVLAASDSPQVLQSAVTPSYFGTMGIALKHGRLLSESDTADGNLVAVVNETAARRYWPGEDPVGKRFAMGSRERFGSFRQLPSPGAIEWREVVGVVADVRSESRASPPQPEVFYSYKQYPLYGPNLIVRTSIDPVAMTSAVRQEIASLNRNAVVTRVRTMEQIAAASVAGQRVRAGLLSLFSALAVILGMLGIYAVMSYSVAQRTQEIGIRVALGARGSEVVRMIIGRALAMTAVGVSLGLLMAFAAARWISSLLFGVKPGDTVTLLATCLLLFAAAALASYLPARKALRIDPMAALRTE